MHTVNLNEKYEIPDAGKLDLAHLVEEFSEFQPDKQFASMDGQPFVHAMSDPEPEFVVSFIREKMKKGSDRKTAIRDLYAFLLDQRYYSQINLLYFAFDVFYRDVALPEKIVDITPLPHENGAPLFKYRLLPGYKIE